MKELLSTKSYGLSVEIRAGFCMLSLYRIAKKAHMIIYIAYYAFWKQVDLL